MTQPAPARRRASRRPNAEYRWSRDKVIDLIRTLAEGGTITSAAQRVGMSRQSVYRLRTRLNASFAELWDEALKVGHQRRYLARRRTA